MIASEQEHFYPVATSSAGGSPHVLFARSSDAHHAHVVGM
jgi:hypothetical protein